VSSIGVFQFDDVLRMSELKLQYSQVTEILDSVTFKRNKYRIFARIIKISPSSLLTSCQMFDRTLLIGCYTYSEQIVKNFLYELIEKDNHQNQSLNLFLNKKVPENGFNPRVLFSDIENLISGNLISGFKFPVNRNSSKIAIYNSMIKARHSYAHSNNYPFNHSNFSDVFDVLDYITFVLKSILNDGQNFWDKYQKLVFSIRELSMRIKKCDLFDDNQQNRSLLRILKKLSGQYAVKYHSRDSSISLIKDASNEIMFFSKVDLRNFGISYLKAVDLASDIQ